jgi:NAD-dependent deacetylase
MSKPVLVALTGAGISAESGLKTFRDSDGLWEGYRVEDVATPGAFAADPERVLRFYNERRKQVAEVEPNAAHRILAELEQYYDVYVVTQNIDDLHERGGASHVLHLHGEIFKMRSARRHHDDAYALPIRGDINLGDAAPDGGQLRPHIVWFEEAVPHLEQAIPLMQAADVFVLVGTSLAVYPAAGLLDYVCPEVPKYVIDRRIPPVKRYQNVIPIEATATEGMAMLKETLLAAKGNQS